MGPAETQKNALGDKVIWVNREYDQFYRYRLWRALSDDRKRFKSLHPTGGREEYTTFIHSVLSEFMEGGGAILFKYDRQQFDYLDADLSSNVVRDFLGEPGGRRRRSQTQGPGVKTTAIKLAVLDAYVKCCYPEKAKSFIPDGFTDLYGNLSAQFFNPEMKLKKVTSSSKTFVPDVALRGGELYRDTKSYHLFFKFFSAPDKNYTVVHAIYFSTNPDVAENCDEIDKLFLPENLSWQYQRYSGLFVSGDGRISFAQLSEVSTSDILSLYFRYAPFGFSAPKTLVLTTSIVSENPNIVVGNKISDDYIFGVYASDEDFKNINRILDNFGWDIVV